jgi:hypothetical protein
MQPAAFTDAGGVWFTLPLVLVSFALIQKR